MNDDTAAPTLDPLSASILPDSRPRIARDPKMIMGSYWVPIFCASCGCQGGRVPEENMTFAFWLCTPCFEKYGALTTMHVMPDEVFFEQVKQEQLEKYGRVLTPGELNEVVAADASPLASLIKDGRSAGG